jgi:hypothetical protein
VYAAIPILIGVTNLSETLVWGIGIGLMIVLLAGSAMACTKVAALDEIPEYASPYDTSRVTRVVRERIRNHFVEHIVSGAPDTTFREACEDSWHFESVDRDDEWIIQDSKSNDITDKRLVECNGIASIVVYSSTPDISEEADHLPEWWNAKD